MVLTYQTKFVESNFLKDLSILYNEIVSDLYKDYYMLGLDRNDLKRDYQIKYGINARYFNSIFIYLKNKITVSKTKYDLNKERNEEKLKKEIKKLKDLEKIKKKSKKTYKSIHYKKRLVQKTKDKINKKYKFNLGTDFEKRNLIFQLIGSSDETFGNSNCQLNENILKIRVPKCLEYKYGKHQIFNVNFKRFNNHGFSKSYIFKYQKGFWFIYLSSEIPKITKISNIKNGVLGVDLNVDSVGLSLVKTDGNYKLTKNIYFNTTDKRSNQRKAIYGDLIKEIVDIAIENKCLICIEDLDFSKTIQDNKNNRILHSFEYSLFRTLIESRCYRYGIELVKVNPAYTSMIGLTNYMARYGLNSATAAGIVIARRYLKYSERIPSTVTPLIPVDIKGHVWKKWSFLTKKVRAFKIKRHEFFDDPNRVLVAYSFFDYV